MKTLHGNVDPVQYIRASTFDRVFIVERGCFACRIQIDNRTLLCHEAPSDATVPNGIQFIEELCELIVGNLPDLWQLGKAYLSNEIGNKVRLSSVPTMLRKALSR